MRPGARLTARLLLFNVLLVFVPVGGLLFLGPYERQLLESQERAMVRQGRLLAAAIAAGGGLDAERVGRLLRELERRSESRLRVVDTAGRLLADSSLLGPRRAATPPAPAGRLRESPLYALGAWPFALWQRLKGPSGIDMAAADEYYATSETLAGPELAAALAGRYGAATRLAPAPARALILYSALPVRVDDRIVGAVLVSQSTARILAQLYEVRLAIFAVFLVSLAAAVLLSLFSEATVARPLRALAGEARALVDGRGRLRGRFRGSRRSDEIGELARALEELTRRLESRQAATEAFAADVSHELKNPLASIRGATEMLASAGSIEERRRFLGIVEQEIARMEQLLTGVREIVGLEAPERSPNVVPVDLARLAEQLVESFRLRAEERTAFVVRRDAGPHVVHGEPERFAALLENLFDNASSFSPANGEVEVELSRDGEKVRVEVADRGPGIPDTHLERIFERFFSWRPESDDPRHAGLGLAIVRAIAEAHGGRVVAANRPGGGARFVVELLAA
jgi:two-component system sensor histidine kinase ChvG